jgi:Endonuclease/Exonuclease/phosphatase family
MPKALIAAVAAALLLAPAALADGGKSSDARFATFNASLNRNFAGQLIIDLSTPANQQAKNVAETIQRIQPDVVLINEFDFDANGTALRLFQDNYLSISQNGAAPIQYGFRFAAESNTGIPTGLDVDNSGGAPGGPNDAYGFGFYPGQFGMAVYSKFPIDPTGIRTFQKFLWKDMPGALLPDNPATPAPADWYSPAVQSIFRLSSKSHWDLPLLVGGKVVHFLVSHPTPPVFDDPPTYPAGVDFNGRRNYDEIRFWADYITPGRSGYIYDDAGGTGGLKPGSLFVIAGDQNSDPLDGDSIPGSIQLLIEHPLVNTKTTPESAGAVQQNALQGGANLTHESDPRFDTADFADTAPGNLRADYVLPRKNMQIVGSGVFWPLNTDPLFRLVGTFPFPTSDHRAVWVDTTVPAN